MLGTYILNQITWNKLGTLQVGPKLELVGRWFRITRHSFWSYLI